MGDHLEDDMSDETEKNPTPFHIEPMPKGNFIHTGDLSNVIAQPGDDRRDIAAKVRGYVSRGYLIPVGRDQDDKRGALLFDAASAVTAAALVAAAAAGLSGKDHFQRIAMAFQSWSGQPGKDAPRCPAAFIFATFDPQGPAQGWGVELHTSRHVKTGRVALHAAVKHGDNGYLGEGVVTVPDDHTPVATLLIPLDGLLPGIRANLRKRKMN